jgi:hypothetical protein
MLAIGRLVQFCPVPSVAVDGLWNEVGVQRRCAIVAADQMEP